MRESISQSSDPHELGRPSSRYKQLSKMSEEFPGIEPTVSCWVVRHANERGYKVIYKVGGPWKTTVTNKQFLIVHLLNKWKKQIINEHFVLLCNIKITFF